MTFLEAFEAGVPLQMRHAFMPDMPPRRITKVVLEQGDLLVFDGQEDDPWNTRHPVCIDLPLTDGGPVWTQGPHIIEEARL